MLLERQLAVKTSKMLRERRFGKFEGTAASEYRKEVERLYGGMEKSSDGWGFKTDPDMESDEELAGRFITFLREVALSHIDKNVLVITHGGCIRVFLMHIGYAEKGELDSGAMKNSGLVVMRSDGIDFFVTAVEGLERKKVSAE